MRWQQEMSKGGSYLAKIKLALWGLLSLVVLCVLMKLFNFSSAPVSSVNEKDSIVPQFSNERLKIPSDLNFAGEQVPLQDIIVTENVEREFMQNTYYLPQNVYLFKKAYKWFPIIESILKKNGVPVDFKYLAVIESGLSNCSSPAQACGFWQFIPETACNYGLELSETVDERLDMVKSTEAACTYFKESFEHFHNWTLVAASYNMGITGLEMQLQKQKSNSFYDLYLNEETTRFVFKILAIKELMSHPTNFGYAASYTNDLPTITTHKLRIDSSIKNLSDFALGRGMNLKILKSLNPWLKSDSFVPMPGKHYSIIVPEEGVNYSDSTLLLNL